MNFGLKLNGDLCIQVFGTMSNEGIKHAIEQEIIIQRVKLSPEQRKSLKTYLNTLTNDDMFVNTCEEMIDLKFGFSKL